MTQSSVSDELVEIANEYFEEGAVLREHVRNALNAIAPRLKAEGLREALEEIPDSYITFRQRIRARADALDPPPQQEDDLLPKLPW